MKVTFTQRLSLSPSAPEESPQFGRMSSGSQHQWWTTFDLCVAPPTMGEFPLDPYVNCLYWSCGLAGLGKSSREDGGKTWTSKRSKRSCLLRERVLLHLQNVLFPFSLVRITGSTGIFPLLLSISTLWRRLPLTSDQLRSISVLLEQNQAPRVPTGSLD